MARINIHVPETIKAQLEKIKQPKETSAGALERVLAAHHQWSAGQGLHLTPEEMAEVQAAVQLSGLSFAEIARQGLLTRARAVTAWAKKLKEIDLNDKSQHTRFFGVAAARIHQKVQELMQQGQTITQALISKETNANLKAIKNYLLQHQAEISKYHQRLADQQRRPKRTAKAKSAPPPEQPAEKLKPQPTPATRKKKRSTKKGKVKSKRAKTKRTKK